MCCLQISAAGAALGSMWPVRAAASSENSTSLRGGLSLTDAVERLVAAQEKAILQNGRRAVELGLIIQDIVRQFFKLGACGDDIRAATPRDTVEAITDEHGRGVKGLAPAASTAAFDDALAVDFPASGGIHAERKARVIDHMEPALIKHRGGNVAAAVGGPDDVALCHVTFTAEPDRRAACGGVAAEKIGRGAIVNDRGGDIARQAMCGEPA